VTKKLPAFYGVFFWLFTWYSKLLRSAMMLSKVDEVPRG
jgi:hypothetical protein